MTIGQPLHGLVLVIGARGCGKTTQLQRIVDEYSRDGHSFVVLDRYGHWGRDTRNVRVLRHVEDEDAAREAIRLAPCTLVVDEIDLAVPAEKPLQGAMREIIHNGRQAKAFDPWRRAGPVALLGSARLPQNLRTDLRKQVDYWFLGRLKAEEPDQVAWFRRAFSPEIADRLLSYPWGRFYEKDCT